MVVHQAFHLIAVGALVAVSATALAEPIHRSDWIPGVGNLTQGEHPLGDMWTFECPPGGSVDVVVDTKDDTNDGQSTIDPVVLVFDGQGNLLDFADDEMSCTFAPVCGFGCPEVRVACGEPGRHSIVVRDFGLADSSGSACRGGGGYDLTVEVVDPVGRSLPEANVKLGGGARPRPVLPGWARDLGMTAIGPILDDQPVPDDQRVPRGIAADKATCIIEGPGRCETSAEASSSR